MHMVYVLLCYVVVCQFISPLDKMAAILQTTFSNAFSWLKKVGFLTKITLEFVPKSTIDNNPTLV